MIAESRLLYIILAALVIALLAAANLYSSQPLYSQSIDDDYSSDTFAVKPPVIDRIDLGQTGDDFSIYAYWNSFTPYEEYDREELLGSIWIVPTQLQYKFSIQIDDEEASSTSGIYPADSEPNRAGVIQVNQTPKWVSAEFQARYLGLDRDRNWVASEWTSFTQTWGTKSTPTATPEPEPTPLPAPTGLSLQQAATGDKRVNVSWNAVPGARNYQIEYSKHQESQWTRQGGTSATAFSLSLPDFGEWDVRVSSCPSHLTWTGCGEAGYAKGTITIVRLPPPAPTGLTLTQHATSDDVIAKWDEAENATRYKVRWRDGQSSLSDPVYVTDTQYTVPLTEYGTWTIRVEACNEAGCGEPAAKAITTAGPGKPNVTVWQYYYDEPQPAARMSWVAVPGANRYEIKRRKSDKSEWLNYTGSIRVTGTLWHFPDWGEWTIGVWACNDVSCGEVTEATVALTAYRVRPVPAKPPAITVVTTENSSEVTVSWSAVGNVDEYIVKWRQVERRGFDPANSKTVHPLKTNTTFNVSEYTEWVVRLEACNTSGCSGPVTHRFEVRHEVLNPLRPDAPSNLAVSAPDNSKEVTASWDAVDNADEYVVKWRRARFGDFDPDNSVTVSSSQTSVTFTASTYDEWVIRLQACNNAGCSRGVAKRITLSEIETITIYDSDIAPIENFQVSLLDSYSRPVVRVYWDRHPIIDEPGGYLKLWRGSSTEPYDFIRLGTGGGIEFNIRLSHYGTWDIMVQPCNASRCGPIAVETITVPPPDSTDGAALRDDE